MIGDKVLREVYELAPRRPALSTVKKRARRLFFGQGGHAFGKFRSGNRVADTRFQFRATTNAEATCARCGFSIHVSTSDSDDIRFYAKDGGPRVGWSECVPPKPGAEPPAAGA